MSKPSLKGLKRFIIPHGVYTQVTGKINRDLLRIYRRVRRGALTKPQAKKEGEKVIRNARAEIMKITLRWFKRNGLKPTEPETTDELDAFTLQKIEEWEGIVSDM